MKRFWLLGVLAAVAFGLAACGGGGGGTPEEEGGAITGDLESVTVTSKTATGDINPSVTAGVGTSNALKFTIGGVDADSDGTIESPALNSVKVTSPAAITLKTLNIVEVPCSSGEKVSESDVAEYYDIGISLDTTSSMEAAASILAGRIAAFATALGDANIDANFAGITVGDAFATKKAAGSEFTDAVSQGSLGEPPSFDLCERPDTGTTLLNSTNMATFFTMVKTAPSFEFGCVGLWLTENYLGSIHRLQDATSWRSGAIRHLITIGDDCAYTDDTPGDGITGVWLPPSPTDLITDLTNTTVHVIGSDSLSCLSNEYDPKGLATATGGQFVAIGDCTSEDTCNVDLTELPIVTSITSGMNYMCNGLSSFYEGTEGCYTFVLNISAVGSTSGETKSGVVTMVICLDFL